MKRFWLLLCSFTAAAAAMTQSRTQSLIYDATAIMNAKYNLNDLLIPNTYGFDVLDARTGELKAQNTRTPAQSFDATTAPGSILEILRRNAGLPSGVNAANIQAAYAHNPFLQNILTETPPPGILPELLDTVEAFHTSPLNSGMGFDIMGNLVNGTADFLIKRAQEEISISVFGRLQSLLNNYPEFNTLFPATCALVKPINAYEYNKSLAALKAAAAEDLKQFVDRIADLYELPRYQLLNQKVPALTLVFSGATFLSGINGQMNFAAAMKDLGQKTFLNENNNYAAFLKLTALISNSLLDKTLGDPENKAPQYIHSEYIASVTHNNVSLLGYLSKIYLGLLWQHVGNIQFVYNGAAHPFSGLLEQWNDTSRYQEALGVVQETLIGIQAIGEELTDLKDQEHNTSLITGRNDVKLKRYILYARLVDASIGFTRIFWDPTNTAAANRLRDIQQLWPSFAGAVNSTLQSFQAREYSLAVARFSDVLKVLYAYLEQVQNDKEQSAQLTGAFKQKLEAQRTVVQAQRDAIDSTLQALSHTSGPTANGDKAAQQQELRGTLVALDAQLKVLDYQHDHAKKILFSLSRVIKCTDLLAAISTAQNSEAVTELLEAYALPAGSSRIKKEARFNFALNAYVGGFFERKAREGKGFSNSYGLTAPIGLTLSTGFRKAGSLSLFGGVFDIGSTIRYKLDNNGQYQQHLSLAGIVSPSVQLVYGFPFFLPLSAGVGCQWISPTSSETSKIHLKPGLNAFIGVDIPLFNLCGSRAF